MVVKNKRTDSGHDGFLVPSIPRAPRSARGKVHLKRKSEDSQLCAIELLASIAGKLLQESESESFASSNASVAGDLPVVLDDAKLETCGDEILKAEDLDVECCEENVFIPEFDSASAGSDSILERSSVVSSPNSTKNVSGGVKPEGFRSSKPREDPVELCLNGAKLSPRKEIVRSASVLVHRKNTDLGFRDDDEKISRGNKPTSKLKAFRPSSRINDRRMRKLLTSKYWKSAPKLKDLELPNVEFLDGGAKALPRKRKMCYTRERYYRDALYKRRKFSDCSFIVTCDGGFSSESVCNSPEMDISDKKDSSGSRFHGANKVSSTVTGHEASFLPKDSHVKFSIKSFRVPELLIDVPENATVASLKRTVMEALTALVRDGLHVGVLLNGKKVRDDNRTLVQSGITSKEDIGSLDFTLELTGRSALPPMGIDDPRLPSPCDISKLAPRSPAIPVVDSGIANAIPDPPPLTCIDNQVANNYEPVPSHTDIGADNLVPDCKALVTVPSADVEPLAMVPLTPKSKRSELVQRRTRRPFSVTEVEALVSAVEEIGTGRWRDVKLRSFENSDHRTYVDLKDKWKTLVHTAKIAPQQRRGEPVPQELLDRVLAAHGFWSQHQCRPSSKNQTSILKIADGPSDRNGVELEAN